MKILDYQGLTLGHPAMDIWTIIYSATDAEYRASSLDNDLQAYFEVLSTYMDSPADYAEFKKEVDERRIYGLVMFGEFYCTSILGTGTRTLEIEIEYPHIMIHTME